MESRETHLQYRLDLSRQTTSLPLRQYLQSTLQLWLHPQRQLGLRRLLRAEAADRLEAAHLAGASFAVKIDAETDFPATLAFLRLASERGLAVTVTAADPAK